MTPVVESALAGGARVPDLFLDEDHFTVRGHALVAETLLERLSQTEVVPGLERLDRPEPSL
jgi:hypothetical protein